MAGTYSPRPGQQTIVEAIDILSRDQRGIRRPQDDRVRGSRMVAERQSSLTVIDAWNGSDDFPWHERDRCHECRFADDELAPLSHTGGGMR